MGTTANPRDVWDFPTSTSSINHTVDEGKHIWIQGFPLASSNPDSTYYPLPSKPEADSASITHQGSGASSLQSPLATVGGNELPQKDYYWMTVFNSQIPISRLKIASPVKTEAAQAPDLNLFIFGHHIHKGDEMAKQKRKEGHPQCPYSRCSKHFMRAGGRRPVSGLGALSRREKSDLPWLRLPTGLDSYLCTPASVGLTTNDIYIFDVDLAVVYTIHVYSRWIYLEWWLGL